MNELAALVSSSAAPVTNGSKLRIDIFNSSDSTLNCQVAWTQLDESGQLLHGSENITAVPQAAPTTGLYTLTNGQLITVTVRQGDTLAEYGQIYGRIQIQEGDVSQISNTTFLSAGYMIGYAPVTFPSYQNQNPYTPAGNVFTEFPTPPAAGAEISFSPTEPIYARLSGFAIPFTASATAASRTVRFTFEFNGTLYENIADRTPITAGQTRNLMGWKGPNMPDDDTFNHYFPIAESFEGNGLGITTNTTNLQVDDQFGQPQVTFHCNVAPA